MLANLMFIWGTAVIWAWSMVSLDRIRLVIYAPYAVAMAFIAVATFYGLLNIMAGWKPGINESSIICMVALSIIADRRRHRRDPWHL